MIVATCPEQGRFAYIATLECSATNPVPDQAAVREQKVWPSRRGISRVHPAEVPRKILFGQRYLCGT